MQTNDINKIADKMLEESFRTVPSYSLPDNFADIVAAKAVRRFAWRQYFGEFLVYLYTFLGLVAVTISMAFLLFGADWQVWKQILINNSSLIFSLNLLALFVLFADKVLLKYFLYKYGQKFNIH